MMTTANEDVKKALNAIKEISDSKLSVDESSFGTSNYLKLSNGTLIQYGLVTMAESTIGYQHTFPVAFFDALYQVFWNCSWYGQTGTGWNYCYDRTKTGCKVVACESTGSDTSKENRAMWFAIGRWK